MAFTSTRSGDGRRQAPPDTGQTGGGAVADPHRRASRYDRKAEPLVNIRAFSGNSIRDIALLLFLICIMGVILVVIFAPSDAKIVYLGLTGVAFTGVIFAIYGRVSLAVVLAGTEVTAWTAYKLFSLYNDGIPLITEDYLWLFVPLALVGTVCLFNYGSSKLETENEMLRSQVADLVMIDALTSLYNLRALYREIPIVTRLCVRNKQPLSLMLIQLRYESELRAFLNARHFDELKQRLAKIAQDTLRVEDKLYAIDEKGTLATLLITDGEGCEIVKNRLKSVIESPSAFGGITDSNVIVSVRIAHARCDGEAEIRPIELKLRVESELQYDV